MSATPADPRGEPLPPGSVRNEFGTVFVEQLGGKVRVTCSVWLPELLGPSAEGWRTGIAVDASKSMRPSFGGCMVASKEFLLDHGMAAHITSEAGDTQVLTAVHDPEAEARLREHLGFNGVGRTENVVQPLAHDFTRYLAEHFDGEGTVHLSYFGCGKAGDGVEDIGEFGSEDASQVNITGPSSNRVGKRSRLAPAVRALSAKFPDARRRLFVVLTDGKFADLDEVRECTALLCRRIAHGGTPLIKFVLIGVGGDVDEHTLKALDPPDQATGIDLWDYKIAGELRALSEIAVELVDENWVIGPPATVADDRGREVARFPDGLPARFAFEVAKECRYFNVEIKGQSAPIRQPLAGVSPARG